MRWAVALLLTSAAFPQPRFVLQPQQLRCPEPRSVTVPTERLAMDYLELSRGRCFGSCPDYVLRIYRNGEVRWKGDNYVAAAGERTSEVASPPAGALLEKFRTPEFWALCEQYTAPISDLPRMNLEVRLGDQVKQVSDYADVAPAFVRELEDAVDELADSHQWRHGDPAAEPLYRIQSDWYLPKPGLTPLMKAAVQRDVDRLKALLVEGASPVNAVDGSGWTALMYAAVGTGKTVPALIDAGANVNHRSPQGYTPLMAAAYFEGPALEALLAAGAQIDQQDAQGVTALMILANRKAADAITLALKAGARADSKDQQGRSALDYLEAIHCGRPLLQRTDYSVKAPREDPSAACRAQADDEEYDRAKAALLAAAGVR